MSKKNITKNSSHFKPQAVSRMIRNISVDYGHFYNETVMQKIKKSKSKKQTVGLMLRHFKLFQMFKNGFIKIKYHKKWDENEDSAANVEYTLGKRKYTVNIPSHHKDTFMDQDEKDAFVMSMAHEFSHIRYIEDSYKYSHFELAVDILFLTIGYSNMAYTFHKKAYNAKKNWLGYIDMEDLSEILNQIEKKRRVIYL